jgi:hypothetical protein
MDVTGQEEHEQKFRAMCRHQLGKMSDKAIGYQLGREVGGYEREEIEREASRRGLATVRCFNCRRDPAQPGDEDALCSTCRSFKDRSRPRWSYDPGAAHALASFANRRAHGARFWVG